MIAIIHIGKSVIAFDGPAVGIAEVVKRHVLGCLDSGQLSVDFRIEVPTGGTAIKVTTQGDVDDLEIARTPLRG